MPNPMTVKGAEDLREEVAHRKGTLRQEISEAIAEARAHGDLKENAEYHAAREQQSLTRVEFKKSSRVWLTLRSLMSVKSRLRGRSFLEPP